MSEPAGYVLNIGERRRARLESAISWDERFAEAVPEFEHNRNYPLLCFVSFQPGIITHIGTGKRGHRAGTALRRLNVNDIDCLSHPVAHEMIVDDVPHQFRASVRARLRRGGLLAPKSFYAMVDALRRLAPETRTVLDRFSEERRKAVMRLSASVRSNLAYEKESIATALALAGIDRTQLNAWQPTDDGESSFLDGLPQARSREDVVVVGDMMHIPGFELIRTKPYSAAVFRNDKVRLTLLLVNHQMLEEQLGADLIYCNETFHSFVFVQYKMMEQDAEGELGFRLPNKQLSEEIRRMEETLKSLGSLKPNTARDGYRLVENPFFLKLCSRIIFDPDTTKLVSGMYLPLDYWKVIASDEALVGRRGGRRINFNNVGRYFENTEFINLVAKAWIGTNINQSAMLAPIIRRVLTTGRSVTLAIESAARK